MTYEDAWKIVDTTEPSDWISNECDDGVMVTVYRNDLNLRFVEDIGYGYSSDFNEDWAIDHPNPNAKKYDIQLYYASSLIGLIPVVSVDGGRARIPFPDLNTKIIPFREYKAAKIGSPSNERLDEYITRSKLTVEQK